MTGPYRKEATMAEEFSMAAAKRAIEEGIAQAGEDMAVLGMQIHKLTHAKSFEKRIVELYVAIIIHIYQILADHCFLYCLDISR